MKKHIFAAAAVMLFMACNTLSVNAAQDDMGYWISGSVPKGGVAESEQGENDTQESTTPAVEEASPEDTVSEESAASEEAEAPVKEEPTGQWQQGAGGWWYQELDGSFPSNGWYEIGGDWYVFDESGYMKTGWYAGNNAWYYLTPGGAMAEGWLNDGGTWYYMNPDSGTMVTGWQEIDDKWYYFDKNGIMQTGWQEQNSKWYYLYDDGAMAEGWLNDGGTWYYMDSDSGIMTTGWQEIEDNWYYLGKKGAMVTGWFQVDQDWYYCYDSGVMAANAFVDGYYLNRNGIWIKDSEQIKSEQALAVAWEITEYVDSLQPECDLHRVGLAAYMVRTYCQKATYTMEGENYKTAYGVFVSGEYSCAGATRALGLVLDCMGYEWEHVNEHLYTHQWVRLTMDGQLGWADGQVGFVGFGKHPAE